VSPITKRRGTRCCQLTFSSLSFQFGPAPFLERITWLSYCAWRSTCMERVNVKSCCRCYLYCQIFCGFGAGAVSEGEIGAEPSLRRPAGALERICMCAASCAVKSCSSFLVMEILKSRTACCKSAWLRSPGRFGKRCCCLVVWKSTCMERKCPCVQCCPAHVLGWCLCCCQVCVHGEYGNSVLSRFAKERKSSLVLHHVSSKIRKHN
jgi:hypothetical protein